MTERPRLRPADVQSEHVGAAAEYLDRHHRFGRFGPSRHYLAWVSDRSYPPKALIARAIWEAGGAELEPDDFRGANNGPYYRRLEQLGFAILPIDPHHQGHRQSATAGTASRSGADRTPRPRAARQFSESDGGPAVDRSPPRAWIPAPVVGLWQLTRHHVFAAAAQCREWDPERDTDSYVLWVNGPWGQRYPLSTLVRAALCYVRRGRRLRATYAWASPEVAHLRHLGFEVLPRGVRPVRRRFDNGMVKPSWINRDTFERAVALFDAIPRYPARWRLDSSEVWSVGNRPYPLRALCLLLTHSWCRLVRGLAPGADASKLGGEISRVWRHRYWTRLEAGLRRGTRQTTNRGSGGCGEAGAERHHVRAPHRCPARPGAVPPGSGAALGQCLCRHGHWSPGRSSRQPRRRLARLRPR